MQIGTARTAFGVAIAVAIALITPAATSAAEFGYQGWGPRVGISQDPDQVFGGIHVNFGEFAPNVRFQPSVDLGIGDDVVTLTGNLMVAYYFPIDAPVTPYAGGQLTAAFYNFDSDCDGFGGNFGGRFSCDDSETEIGPAAVGGIEMKLTGGSRFLAEIQLGFSDLPEAKLLAGWTF